jgi:replicative superfamily II helicase
MDDIDHVAGYVEETMMMSLDDDWPDNEERCLNHIMDELNVDTDEAQKIFNEIMEIK